MWIFCILGLHAWENKRAILQKNWYAINNLRECGFDPVPVTVEQFTFAYKECLHCHQIKPRRTE